MDLKFPANLRDTNMDQPVSPALLVRPVDLFENPSTAPLVSERVSREIFATSYESTFVFCNGINIERLDGIQGDIVRHALRDLEADLLRRRIVSEREFLQTDISDLVSLDENAQRLE